MRSFPKVMSLLKTIDDYENRQFLEYDLIRLGLRLRWFLDEDDDRLDWSDMLAIVYGGPQTSQFNLHSHPEDAIWTPEMMLIASAVDELRTQTWMKTEDGSKGKNRPEQIERPGVQPKKKVEKTGGNKEDLKTASDMMEFLGIAN